jgi:hypothetical protein
LITPETKHGGELTSAERDANDAYLAGRAAGATGATGATGAAGATGSGGVPSEDPDFTGTLGVPQFGIAGGLPSASVPSSWRMIIVIDANGGVGTLAFSNGTNWIDVKTGLPVVA